MKPNDGFPNVSAVFHPGSAFSVGRSEYSAYVSNGQIMMVNNLTLKRVYQRPLYAQY